MIWGYHYFWKHPNFGTKVDQVTSTLQLKQAARPLPMGLNRVYNNPTVITSSFPMQNRPFQGQHSTHSMYYYEKGPIEWYSHVFDRSLSVASFSGRLTRKTFAKLHYHSHLGFPQHLSSFSVCQKKRQTSQKKKQQLGLSKERVT